MHVPSQPKHISRFQVAPVHFRVADKSGALDPSPPSHYAVYNQIEGPAKVQGLTILIALATAVWFAIGLAKSPRGRRGLLTFSMLDLVGVAAYETYMHAIWEKSVHAPIRIDVFVIDLPLLILGIATGIVGIYRSMSSRDLQ
jgi:hypothetical protein